MMTAGDLAETASGTTDVLLLCALKDEYDEVLRVTDGLVATAWTQRRGPGGWIVADGTFSTRHPVSLKIRATWTSHMGRESVQAVASRLIHEQPAQCLAISGICAGRRGKVSLGDVIFADRLWSYDSGKITTESGERRFQGDMLQYRPPGQWIQRMQQISVPPTSMWLSERPLHPLERQEDWVLMKLGAGEDPRTNAEFHQICPDWAAVVARLTKRNWLRGGLKLTEIGRQRASELSVFYSQDIPSPPEFRIHVAPLATGAAVVENEGIFPRLAESMRKVLGVDMESSALAALGEAHDIPILAAKGVSDYGDAFKDDRYRRFAARAAAECLIALLRNSADLLPRSQQHSNSAGKIRSAPATAATHPLPLDLIRTLADEYPDLPAIRALWQRAGGRPSEVEQISRPQDLWQRLWTKSVQGASVRPEALLAAALQDLPGNVVLLRYCTELKNSH